jgi:hypothetical protein
MKLTNEFLKELVLETIKEEGALVSVKAGKPDKTGQKNANFKEKKNNPSIDVSEPFVEKAKEDAGKKLDKENGVVPKTFVSGKASPKAQTKPEVSKKAPKSDTDKRIAKAEFELKESYTKSDLIKLIKEQARKMLK